MLNQKENEWLQSQEDLRLSKLDDPESWGPVNTDEQDCLADFDGWEDALRYDD